jgi:hypothetical protein
MSFFAHFNSRPPNLLSLTLWDDSIVSGVLDGTLFKSPYEDFL